MTGHHERVARELAQDVGAFILVFDESDSKVNAVMEVDGFRGVGGTGSSREKAFENLIQNAENYSWEGASDPK